MAIKLKAGNRKKHAKKKSQRKIIEEISRSSMWVVRRGQLARPAGRPSKQTSLFRIVAEKIPYDNLEDVASDMKSRGESSQGVYLCHDSMGVVRYAGRGDIFSRLRIRYRAKKIELFYFSFYVISQNNHQREVETLIIRACSHILEFNTRKKRAAVVSGNITDYESGTDFYEKSRVRANAKVA